MRFVPVHHAELGLDAVVPESALAIHQAKGWQPVDVDGAGETPDPEPAAPADSEEE